jgi:hypothetical protein
VVWRSAVLVAYAALALVCSVVLGGGFVVLGFFCVWGLVWLAFSLFFGWADRSRQRLLRRGSSS